MMTESEQQTESTESYFAQEQDAEKTIPPPDEDCEVDQRRLWIGNLDPRVTEFALLKILQKYGTLQKFDFLYHKSGPDQGKPRGYCFVTYATKQEAECAMKKLNGKLALSQRLVVKQAHADKKETSDETKAKMSLLAKSALQTNPTTDKLSVDSKIRAIETKLKHMEQGIDDAPSWNPAVTRNNPSSSRHWPNSNHRRRPFYNRR